MRRYWLSIRGAALALVLAPILGLGVAKGAPLAGDPPPDAAQQGEVALAFTVASKISYQGYITEDGNPVTGTRDLSFSLYADSGCAILVDTIAKPGTAVNDGYFTVDLAVDPSDFDGQRLWVGTTVGATVVGCQEILPVPYALSLRPGAEIVEDPEYVVAIMSASSPDEVYRAALVQGAGAFHASVYGYNGGTGAAVYGNAAGNSTVGVLGESTSVNGYGGRFSNSWESGVALKVEGSGIIESSAETEIAVSPYKIVSESGSNVETVMGGTGYAILRPSNTGTDYVLLPIDAPLALFGTLLKVKSVRICYMAEQGGDYITSTYVRSMGSIDYTTHISSLTDHSSTTPDCYTIMAGTPTGITGPLYIRFGLQYGGTGDTHDIHIGRVVLTLVE